VFKCAFGKLVGDDDNSAGRAGGLACSPSRGDLDQFEATGAARYLESGVMRGTFFGIAALIATVLTGTHVSAASICPLNRRWTVSAGDHKLSVVGSVYVRTNFVLCFSALTDSGRDVALF